MLPLSGSPPGLPWPSLQGLYFAFQSPTISDEGPAVLAHTECSFHLRRATQSIWEVSLGLSLPVCAKRRAEVGGGDDCSAGMGVGVGVAGASVPAGPAFPQLLALPWLPHKPSPSSIPHWLVLHPQTRSFQGPCLLGVMETVSRHPQQAPSLAGEPAGKDHPQGHF